MYDFVFVDETRIAVTGDGFIELGNVETGEVEPKIYVPKILSRGGGGGGIGFSPDGRLLLLGTDTGVVRVELASNRRDSHDWLAGSNREFGNAGRSRLISPHGDRFIYYDSKPRVLDFRDDSQRLLTQTEFIAAPDTRVQILGRWLLYLSSDSSHDNINGLNLATGEAVVDIRSGVGPGRLSGDGIPFISKAGRLHVAVGSKTSVEKLHIEVLPNSNGSVEHQIFPQFEALSGFHLNIGRMHWADDGAEYWQNSNDGKQVRFWDVRTGKVLRTISRGVEIGEGLHFFPGSTLLIRRRSTKNNSEIEYLINKLRDDSTVPPVTVHLDAKRYFTGVSGDDRRMVVLNADGPQRVIVWNTADGEQVASFETPSDIPTLDAARSSQLQLSRSGQFLLVYDRIYDIDARSINTVWKAQDHSTVYFGSGLLGDEQHIVMRLGDRYEVWDWRKNEKRMTIFLLPQKQWMVFNHETDCWNGSNFAFRHVEFLFRDANGKEEWVVPPIYEHRTGWENDPSKAGLSDLARRPPDK